MALGPRRPEAVIHHSDQGGQYSLLAFGRRCRQAGVRPSRGPGGDCFDNALCESFFVTPECEMLDRRCFPTHAVARREIFDYIESWYNRHRRHSALNYESPMHFERAHVPPQVASCGTSRGSPAHPVSRTGPGARPVPRAPPPPGLRGRGTSHSTTSTFGKKPVEST